LTQDVVSLQDIPVKKGTGLNSVGINGNNPTGAYAVAEGNGARAGGLAAHSEGNLTEASGSASHAEGGSTRASGTYAHAEGQYSAASGECAHGEGYSTNAAGRNSHAQNLGTVARGMNQTTIGKYNIEQGSASSVVNTDYALIVGNGEDSDHRSNALAVQWDGTVVFQDNSTIKSAKTVYEVMGKMGAKNLFYFNEQFPTDYGGINYSLNGHGGIIIDGTVENYSGVNLMHWTNKSLGDYTLSIDHALIHDTYIQIMDATTSTVIGWVGQNNAGYSKNTHTFTISAENINHDMYIRTALASDGTVYDNETIYIMLRLASDQDDTWQPYAMTNKQLTDKLNDRVEFTAQELQAMW
jgi:hypothetical protein